MILDSIELRVLFPMPTEWNRKPMVTIGEGHDYSCPNPLTIATKKEAENK